MKHRSIALLLITAALGLAGTAGGGTRSAMIVMHEPGCHWFQVGSKYKTSLTRTGPLMLANYDEAPVRVKGTGTTRLIKVGARIKLRAGKYTIRMVKQAKDDNTLHLTVR